MYSIPAKVRFKNNILHQNAGYCDSTNQAKEKNILHKNASCFGNINQAEVKLRKFFYIIMVDDVIREGSNQFKM